MIALFYNCMCKNYAATPKIFAVFKCQIRCVQNMPAEILAWSMTGGESMILIDNRSVFLRLRPSTFSALLQVRHTGPWYIPCHIWEWREWCIGNPQHGHVFRSRNAAWDMANFRSLLGVLRGIKKEIVPCRCDLLNIDGLIKGSWPFLFIFSFQL